VSTAFKQAPATDKKLLLFDFYLVTIFHFISCYFISPYTYFSHCHIVKHSLICCRILIYEQFPLQLTRVAVPESNGPISSTATAREYVILPRAPSKCLYSGLMMIERINRLRLRIILSSA